MTLSLYVPKSSGRNGRIGDISAPLPTSGVAGTGRHHPAGTLSPYLLHAVIQSEIGTNLVQTFI
jgi:hypothetical protein